MQDFSTWLKMRAEITRIWKYQNKALTHHCSTLIYKQVQVHCYIVK